MGALGIKILTYGGAALGISGLFGGKKDDSLLDDLTPVIALAVAGIAIYALAKR